MRSSPALFAAALLLTLTAPAAAIDKYIGFGDSITRGSGWPSAPGIVFDEQSANCNNAELCGFVPRLEDELASRGLNVNVVNKGFAGETTTEGLSRIDSVLAGGGEVVILMEGTNDLSKLIRGEPGAISVASMKANLGAMTNKATAQGFDTLISSVIRRIDNSNLNAVGIPNEPNTKSFKTKTQQLAQEKDRIWANPWETICNTQSCYNNHYYQDGGPNDPGHPDASGYGIMADVFADAITSKPAPGAPSLTSPSGDTGPAPTFTWSEIGVAHLYRLSVDGPAGNVYDAWHDGKASCSGGTCTATLPFGLGDGSHSWRLKARNLRGTSAWSAALGFVVYAAPPVATTPLDPVGDLWSATPIMQAYEWDAVSDATQYRLQVMDTASTFVDEVHAASSACSGPTCSATPAGELGAGAYSWRVRPENPAGNGPWTAWTAFTIFDASPGAATPDLPAGDIFDTDPDFTWSHVPGAEDYLLGVYDGTGSIYSEWHLAADVCGSWSCAVAAPITLTPGDYTWDLMSRNPLGDGPVSAAASFTVLPCDPPVDLVVPAEEVSTDKSWSACVSITLQAGFRVLTGGSASFHAGVEIRVESGVDVEDGGTLTLRLDP